jgi:xylulokinase
MPLFMPHLYGCDSPENDPESKGAFLGITASVSKADMLYALIEGVNFQSVSLVHSMEKTISSEFKNIHAIGTISTNNYIMQQKADILGRSIWVDTKNTEAVCLGAAMLAGVGAGIFTNVFESYRCLDNTLTEIRPKSEMYDFYSERYRLFKQMYPALASLNKSIPYS